MTFSKRLNRRRLGTVSIPRKNVGVFLLEKKRARISFAGGFVTNTRARPRFEWATGFRVRVRCFKVGGKRRRFGRNTAT